METETTLIRTDSAVELYAITKVHMNFAIVVNPWHTECNDTLRLHDTLDDFCFFKLRMLIVNVLNGD